MAGYEIKEPTDHDYPNKFTFFWRKESPFSQWHASKFLEGGVLYNCAEQYMMHQKALLMGDKEIAEEILKTEHPKDQKSLGRRVKNYDDELWQSKCYDVVKQGNMLKFGQNEKLRQTLFETAGTTLVEASPVDCIWGIGLSADNPAAKDRSQWKGKNLLGFALTDVREQLMVSHPKGSMSDNYSTNYAFFWQSESPFSQWHPSEFIVDGINFNCAEQYMMYQKAILMGDEEIAQKVQKEKSPRKQKALGRKVKNFDAALWDSKCYDCVKRGNYHKNENLKQSLLDTAGKTLVEASPLDTIWGIGLEACDPKALNKDTWRGKNLLGFALTDVREQLMCSDKTEADNYPTLYTFFWKIESPFSQWHPAKFAVNGVEFNCAEQFMMYNKAMIMEDEETAQKILEETNPQKQKALGKTVKNLDTDHDRWNSKCVDVVKQGNYHKFTQNEDLKQILLDTAGTTLVEASPYDRKWGIGLEASDPKALDRNTWNGRNLLGFALTDVREQLLGN